MERTVFLSHAAADAQLAERISTEIRERDSHVRVFLASRPGDIRADEQWPTAIQNELRTAATYLVLLTPNSLDRPWVWFETGAAWMSGKPVVIALAPGLVPRDVPQPLALWQLQSLESAPEAAAILAALEVNAADTQDFASAVVRLGHNAREVALLAAGWQGITVNGAFYAWDGPLHNLDDRNPISEPPGLIDALRAVPVRPSWAPKVGLAQYFRDGAHQVFQTDRVTFRREIVWGDVLLIVRLEGP